MKAEWEVNICARACSKSNFFSTGGSLFRFDAYCSDYSAIHTLDCSNYSGSDYYATLGPDSDSDNCFPHTVLATAIDSD